MADNKEVTFESILTLYDLAEKLLDTVAEQEDHEHYLSIIEPLIEQLEQSADELASHYRGIAKQGKPINQETKAEFENALKKIFQMIEECKHKVY